MEGVVSMNDPKWKGSQCEQPGHGDGLFLSYDV